MTTGKELKQSDKLADVLYDIRGPVLEEARRLEDLGHRVEKGNIARSDLYIAEEIFCVGTAAEVSAINSVDDRAVPCPGPITKQVADTYGKAVRGQIPQYKHWCEPAK